MNGRVRKSKLTAIAKARDKLTACVFPIRIKRRYGDERYKDI